MIRFPAALLAVVLVSGGAQAQDLGLDLTDDSKKEPPKKDEPPPLPAPKPAAKKPKEEVPDAPKVTEGDEQAEREVILEDRVKAVQRKVYLKKGRFELSPFIGIGVNDAYYSKYSLTGLVAYYLADTLAVAGRFSLTRVFKTDDIKVANDVFDSRVFNSDPQWVAMADVLWSPIYGKVTIFNTILHFDAYLIGGMGAVDSIQQYGEGQNIAFDLGVGMKFVAKDYLAVNAALINTSYVDTPVGTNQAITQNLMTLNVGFSLFVPFKSTGRESE